MGAGGIQQSHVLEYRFDCVMACALCLRDGVTFAYKDVATAAARVVV